MVVLVSPVLEGETVSSNGQLTRLREFGAKDGYEVVDVAPWLDGAPAADIRFDGCHFNAEGHRRIGAHLADYFLANDLR